MKRSTILAALGAASLVAIGSPSSAGDHPDHDRESRSLVGAWKVVVTLRVPAADCTTAAPVGVGPNPFPSFNTFHAGGTMSEWGARSPPATRSSGHGVWRRSGRDQYRYRMQFHSFDVNGLLTATMEINSDLTLGKDRDQFEGVARFVQTDLSGNARPFCATLEGGRLTVP
jgi:hypothetical protein